MTAGVPRVAVLGGTGWVGRHVCETLARRGHGVLAVARNPVPHLRGLDFVAVDLAAAPTGTVADLLATHRVDVVVNATDAANATDGWSRTDEELHRANVLLVRRLLAAMASVPRRPRLVHLGTIFEYGPVPRGELVHESVPPRPAGSYARTKLAGSAAVLGACRTGSISGVVLRLVNVCGPHPSPASFPGKLLATVRRAVAEGGDVELSIARARRDFVDVRDVAEACAAAVGSTVTARAVNIGSGTAVGPRDLVESLLTAAGLPSTALRIRDEVVPSLGPDWVRADVRLAAALLGWRPRTSLAESLQAMWDVADELNPITAESRDAG